MLGFSSFLSHQQQELQIGSPRLSSEADANGPSTTPELSGHQGYLITGANYEHIIGVRQHGVRVGTQVLESRNSNPISATHLLCDPGTFT